MKAWSVIGLLFGAASLATIPISPQATSRGVELRIDRAQAQIAYGRYRRAYRTAPGYYSHGWVPKYGPPLNAYPGFYYYRPYYPYPGYDVPRWGPGFYFGNFYSNG